MTRFIFLQIFIFMTILTSCSSSESPLSPSTDEPMQNAVHVPSLPVAVSDWSEDFSPVGGKGIFGLFDISIDSDTLTGEIVPLRSASITDVYEAVDISTMLSGSPCKDCIRLNSIGMNEDGFLVLRFAIRHPVAMGNPEEPITGSNRADLMVYNVEGLVVSNGYATFGALDEIVPVSKLVNADGYSSYMDISLDRIFNTSATIHPYIMHYRDYSHGNFDSVSNPETGFPPPPVKPVGNLVMTQGSDFDEQDYIFDLKGARRIQFIYAVQCTFGITTSEKTQRFQPQSRVPQHNKKAASEVRVSIISNGLIGNVINSQAVLRVQILDINHDIPTGNDLDKMLAFSNVKQISIMIPSVTPTPITVDYPLPLSGDPRDPDNPLTYHITISNQGTARPGNYYGLCKVLDSYSAGQNQTIPGADGIARIKHNESTFDGLFAIPEFATYQVFKISVAEDPNVTLLYEIDPLRTSINISNLSLNYPVDSIGFHDLGVCENIFEPDIDGIYMFDVNQQIVRFDRNYTNSVFQAPGFYPSNDSGTHPDPANPMPGYRLDVASNGFIISSYFDPHQSWDVSRYRPYFTEYFPESNFWARWEPILPRPIDITANHPHSNANYPVQVCFATNPPPGNKYEMPMAHEGWDESNFITVSSPSSGDPMGTLPYDQPDNAISVMFRYTNQLFMDPQKGFAAVYYGHYPPYYDKNTSTFFSLYKYAWELYAISADEIVGVDRSDKDWLFICASGEKSMIASQSNSTENLFLIDSNQPYSAGRILDLQTALSTDAKVLDVECIPYDPNNPIIFNIPPHNSVSQIASIGALLFSDKKIYLIAFDDTLGNESFLIYQTIDGSNYITGEPKRLDIGEETYDIHVTSSDGLNAYVTVFRLTAQ